MKLLAALAFLLAGCAHTEVTVMFGPRSVEGETDLGAFLMISQPFGKRGVCSVYMHESSPLKGEPFNNRDEIDSNAAMCGVRWGGR